MYGLRLKKQYDIWEVLRTREQKINIYTYIRNENTRDKSESTFIAIGYAVDTTQKDNKSEDGISRKGLNVIQ